MLHGGPLGAGSAHDVSILLEELVNNCLLSKDFAFCERLALTLSNVVASALRISKASLDNSRAALNV